MSKNLYVLRMQPDDNTRKYLATTMAASPVPFHIEEFYLPIAWANEPFELPLDFANKSVVANPQGLKLPYSALLEATCLCIQLEMPGFANLYAEVSKGMKSHVTPSIFSEPFEHPYVIMCRMPPLQRNYRGWVANMSTTINRSSPSFVFDNPQIYHYII